MHGRKLIDLKFKFEANLRKIFANGSPPPPLRSRARGNFLSARTDASQDLSNGVTGGNSSVLLNSARWAVCNTQEHEDSYLGMIACLSDERIAPSAESGVEGTGSLVLLNLFAHVSALLWMCSFCAPFINAKPGTTHEMSLFHPSIRQTREICMETPCNMVVVNGLLRFQAPLVRFEFPTKSRTS